MEGDQLIDKICDVDTLACKDIDETKWQRTRFYLDGEELPQSSITYGSGDKVYTEDNKQKVNLDINKHKESKKAPKPAKPDDSKISKPEVQEPEPEVVEKGWWNTDIEDLWMGRGD